ncbi:MAG: hypothetical protein ABTQ32_05535 [Myxococcaceae bacterium]
MDFHHFELRTTDVAAARKFYEAVLAPLDALVSELLAVARARGAPAHWLGHLHVDDLERTTARFLEAGAERLGPARTSDDDAPIIGLRDPFGAAVALTSRPVRATVRARPIHVSHAPESARQLYALDATFLPITNEKTHAQWIFPIVVTNFDETIDRIRSLGGDVMITPGGAYAHDPQGAAFVITER